jgi:hypothetical protein
MGLAALNPSYGVRKQGVDCPDKPGHDAERAAIEQRQVTPRRLKKAQILPELCRSAVLIASGELGMGTFCLPIKNTANGRFSATVHA